MYLNMIISRSTTPESRLIEGAAEELVAMSEEKDIPAINRNAKRILASVKLIKIQISDILDFGI